MAKSKMTDFKIIWQDKDLSFKLKLKIMKVLVWTLGTYLAEGWTLISEDKKEDSTFLDVVSPKASQCYL